MQLRAEITIFGHDSLLLMFVLFGYGFNFQWDSMGYLGFLLDSLAVHFRGKIKWVLGM